MNDREMARGLGWTSLAIGVAELAMPQKIERMMGIGDGQNTGILRVLGVRELFHGMDLLQHDTRPEPGVWSRLAGDALDGVLLAKAATSTRRPASFVVMSALVLAVAAADLLFARRLAARK